MGWYSQTLTFRTSVARVKQLTAALPCYDADYRRQVHRNQTQKLCATWRSDELGSDWCGQKHPASVAKSSLVVGLHIKLADQAIKRLIQYTAIRQIRAQRFKQQKVSFSVVLAPKAYSLGTQPSHRLILSVFLSVSDKANLIKANEYKAFKASLDSGLGTNRQFHEVSRSITNPHS